MNSLPLHTPPPSKRQKTQLLILDDDSAKNTPRSLRPVQSVRSDSSHQSSSSSHSSVVSARSRSSTKQMAEMLFAPQPILYEQFVPASSGGHPAELNTIWHTIQRQFSRGLGVVSDAYKVQEASFEAVSYIHSITDSWGKTEIAKIADNAFGEIDNLAFTHSSKLPGPSPTPQQCAKAVRRAWQCEKNKCCEAAWNSGVHDFVLDLAIDNNEFRDKVGFVNWYVRVVSGCRTTANTPNSTSARISPSSLIPPGQAGTALNSKMVDFAIHIEPSDRFRKAVHERAQLSPTPMSVNHTLDESLRWRPIGVSIETKHTGRNWDDAMAQVGIWTAAQFTKLEELAKEADEISETHGSLRAGPGVQLPFLPIVIVQGHDWNFLAAVRDPGKQTVSVMLKPFPRNV